MESEETHDLFTLTRSHEEQPPEHLDSALIVLSERGPLEYMTSTPYGQAAMNGHGKYLVKVNTLVIVDQLC